MGINTIAPNIRAISIGDHAETPPPRLDSSGEALRNLEAALPAVTGAGTPPKDKDLAATPESTPKQSRRRCDTCNAATMNRVATLLGFCVTSWSG
jgi:hypothetical protein